MLTPYTIQNREENGDLYIDISINIDGVPLQLNFIRRKESNRLTLNIQHKNLTTNKMENVISENFSLCWKPIEEPPGNIIFSSLVHKQQQEDRDKYNTRPRPEGDTTYPKKYNKYKGNKNHNNPNKPSNPNKHKKHFNKPRHQNNKSVPNKNVSATNKNINVRRKPTP